MKNEQSLQNLLTRRKFLIGTAGLALSSVLPACSQTAKTVQTQPTAPEISTLTNRELMVSCYWVARGEHENSYALFKETVEATTDFSWLSKGKIPIFYFNNISFNSTRLWTAGDR